MQIKVIRTSDHFDTNGVICTCDHLEDIVEKLIQEEGTDVIVYKPNPNDYPTPGCSSDYVVEIYDDYRE